MSRQGTDSKTLNLSKLLTNFIEQWNQAVEHLEIAADFCSIYKRKIERM